MKTGHVTLVLGGCRSGKSRYALQYAERYLGKHNSFIATCVPVDREMQERVARHQSERDKAWKTVEAPVHLAKTIEAESRLADVMLVDCLTLWMSNLFMEAGEQDKIDRHVRRLTDTLATAQCPLILVSNEVGTGIVPDNRLAREYRDAVGWMNQAVATVSDQVVMTVAGIPMVVKKG